MTVLRERSPGPDSRRQEQQEGEEMEKKGALKIFFGYAPGAGKTYAMLREAQRKLAEDKADVVLGYISRDCGKKESEIRRRMEQLPNLEFRQNGELRAEFDLDGAIRRNPDLVVIDNLAHANAVGSRHRKRYQDVRELLNAGIDVYTTLNVQNIESLSDKIASITGEMLGDRVPDFIFDEADQVEFIDIAPQELVEKQRRQGQKDGGHYSLEVLSSLRDLAMRSYLDRISTAGKRREQKGGHYFADEHILVCLSPSASNDKTVRTAARMAYAFRAAFTALYVETSDFEMMDEKDKQRLQGNMHLAQQLGATVEIVYGDDIPFQIAEFARLSGVSKVVIGRSVRTGRGLFKKQPLTDQLLMHVPNLNVHIIPDRETSLSAYRARRPGSWLKFSLMDIAKSIGILVAGSLIGFLFEKLGFAEANIITIYVLAVLIISVVSNNRVYSLISSVVSVMVFNFLFTDPKFTLQAYDQGYPVTFVVMFIAALLTGTLAAKLKSNARQSAQAAFRMKVLFDTNQLMQQAQSNEEILSATAQQLLRLLKRDIIIYPLEKGELGKPELFAAKEDSRIEEYTCQEEKQVALWALKNNKHAGATTQTFSNARCLYLAIRVKNDVHGVVGIESSQQSFDAFENSILLSILGECALALENRKNAIEKEQAAVLAKNEQLRANLLRMISHDLRTPLTSISGNASNLLYNGESFDVETKNRLYQDIYDDSMWLINLVENLLSVTRLEEGRLNLHLSAELVEEAVKEALRHVSRLKTERQITVEHEEEFLLAKMDAKLVVQVIINLIDNAIKYTPRGSHIEIRTRREENWAVISVADDGPGIPDENKAQVFEMFYSGANRVADSRRSLGLGLSLCRAIVNAHGGTMEVADNVPHGAVFTFTLPIEEVQLHE